jgi:hypothetical protein
VLAKSFFESRQMVIDFRATLTEADFKRPLLDAAEDRLVREARGDVDLAVEGLRDTLLSRILRLFMGVR